jgi:hypothetical protein
MKIVFPFLLSLLFFGISFSNPTRILAQVCQVGTQGGNQVTSCGICGQSGGAAGYCCNASSANKSCTCSASSCSCTVDSMTCTTVSQISKCTCYQTGADCTGGGACPSSPYGNNVCNCVLQPPVCGQKDTKTTLFCAWTGGPTSVPPTNSPPTNSPPNPTATPAIQGRLYLDNNDGTVAVVGGLCVRQGVGPTPVSVAGSSIKATKASNNAVSNGVITGSNYTITGLVSTASDYQVALTLPTPAPDSITSYICGCPITAGNDYLCQYSNISANGSPNFFVKQNNLAVAWWQTYGGSVYARDQIETKIPVNTCDANATCESALIVGGLNTNASGLAVLGSGGVLHTTSDGSTAYVQSAGSRTTANGSYAVGVQPGKEDYQFFYGNLSKQIVSFSSLGELQAKITAMSSNTTGLFVYAGAGDLTVDKSGSSTPITVDNGKRVVVFVPNNLQFTNSAASAAPVLTDVPVGTFLMFLVRGNITVNSAVGYTNAATNPASADPNLEGVFMADGKITIQGDGDNTVADRKFIGSGTFVAWDKNSLGNAVELQRTFTNSVTGQTTNSTTPAEVFVYRPDFVANFPTELKTAHYNWQELAPQK